MAESTENNAVIDARGLSMEFGHFRALSEVSFQVRKGELVGLLGPNGAGKTTTMRILTTYLVPTAGGATVTGFEIQKEPIEVRRRVGYLPETAPLYTDMEVAEYLSFVGRARGLVKPKLGERIDWVLGTCEIKSVYRRPIQELSKGFRQRVGLAQALIHDPELLILDEPTSGLDPLQIIAIRNLLKQVVAGGKTVILSTHILQEVVAVTERVIVISDGRIVADGKVDELRRRAASGRAVTVLLKGDLDPSLAEAALSGLGPVQSRIEGGRVRIDVTAEPEEVYRRLKPTAWVICELREVVPTLDEAFERLITQSRGGANGGAKA
jgi:ABC-2 type transport system ATP-binding protein